MKFRITFEREVEAEADHKAIQKLIEQMSLENGTIYNELQVERIKSCFICGNTEEEADLIPLDHPESDKYICEECKSHITG